MHFFNLYVWSANYSDFSKVWQMKFRRWHVILTEIANMSPGQKNLESCQTNVLEQSLSSPLAFPILVNIKPYQKYTKITQNAVFNFFGAKFGVLPFLQECPSSSFLFRSFVTGRQEFVFNQHSLFQEVCSKAMTKNNLTLCTMRVCWRDQSTKSSSLPVRKPGRCKTRRPHNCGASSICCSFCNREKNPGQEEEEASDICWGMSIWILNINCCSHHIFVKGCVWRVGKPQFSVSMQNLSRTPKICFTLGPIPRCHCQSFLL